MTRARIAAGLHLLVLQLANGETRCPEDWQASEWAFVTGLASGKVMELERAILGDAP